MDSKCEIPVLGIFLDTETSGLNSQVHHILELAFKIIDLKTGRLQESYQTIIAQPLEVWKKGDPESLRINGFSWEEVAQGKPPIQTAEEVIHCFTKWNIRRKEAVFICQNPSFDRIFFAQLIDADNQESRKWPYHWLDLASMYWAIAMNQAKHSQGKFPWETGFSKDMIASHYKLPTEAKPHRAMNGVDHLLLCYQAVVGFPNQ